MKKEEQLEATNSLISKICTAIASGADDEAEMEVETEQGTFKQKVSLCDALKKLINRRKELEDDISSVKFSDSEGN